MLPQGECEAYWSQQPYYACAFPTFIAAWRRLFRAASALFAFELLPAYVNNNGAAVNELPLVRDAQLGALRDDDANIVVVNAVDLGDPVAPEGSIHPRDKRTVGARFAAAALNRVYGQGAK